MRPASKDLMARQPANGVRSSMELQLEHSERLQSLTASLSLAATLPQVADAVLQGSRNAFPESVATIIVKRSASGEDIEVFAVSELDQQLFDNWKTFPLSSETPIAEVVRSGELLCLESPDDWLKRYPNLGHLLAETGHRAQVIAPLVVGGKTIGALGVAFTTDQSFTPSDRDFASALALQCAVALERARLFEVDRAARAAAESASKAKSDFLAAMSHELLTPLNAIGGYAELIDMGVHGPVTPAQKVALNRIQTSQKHLVGLIQSVLEFSQTDAAATPYQMCSVSVQETLDVGEQLTAPQMMDAKIIYSVKMDAPDTTVYADPQKLRQILINLLSNAIKHTGEGGNITVTVTRDDDEVHISIADTGHGIDAKNLEVIFDPFVQIVGARGPTRGVGLGLPISRNLARGMGGDLTAWSQMGRGSTFTLMLKRPA